jgi:16S rRNA (uracil1498-N3)-methyltransferase
LFDSDGKIRKAEVVSISKSASELKILDSAETTAGFSLGTSSINVNTDGMRISLAVGMPKAGRGDWLVEKAVELGTSDVIPLTTKHAVLKTKVDGDGESGRLDRWRRLASAAAKQSLTPEIPSVLEPQSIDTLIAARKYDVVMWGCMPNDPIHKPKSLFSVPQAPLINAKSILLCIGPEGDFSSSEKTLLMQNGALPVWISLNRLRVETAAITMVSVLQLLLASSPKPS